jgi:small subunit ribosomal protein S17
MKRRYKGVVVKNGAAKTIRVDVQRVYRHKLYGKILRRTVSCHAHDEREQANVGDLVEIVESRPMSRLKRWSLVSNVTR